MIQSWVTAGTSLAALTEDTSRATLHTLVSTGRQRHSVRAQKARPEWRTPRSPEDRHRRPAGDPVAARARPGLAGYLHKHREEGGTPRSGRGRGLWNRTPTGASRGSLPCPRTGKPAINPDNKTVTGLQDRNAPNGHRHLKSLVMGHAPQRSRLPPSRGRIVMCYSFSRLKGWNSAMPRPLRFCTQNSRRRDSVSPAEYIPNCSRKKSLTTDVRKCKGAVNSS
jgi:hypothetical protein